MANLLALDTSGSFCSVSLYQTHLAPDYNNSNLGLNPALSIASDALLSLHETADRTHTKRLLPMVQEVLTQRGLLPTDLNAIAYGCGPGSFTGIRIAAGVAQGLAFGLDVPLIPVSTLRAMALQAYLTSDADAPKLHLCCLDARMGEIYYAGMSVNHVHGSEHDEHSSHTVCHPVITPVIPEQLLKPEQLKLAAINPLAPLGYTLNGSGVEVDNFPAEVIAAAHKVDSLVHPNALYMALLAAANIDAYSDTLPEDAQPVYLRDEVTWQKLPQYQVN